MIAKKILQVGSSCDPQLESACFLQPFMNLKFDILVSSLCFQIGQVLPLYGRAVLIGTIGAGLASVHIAALAKKPPPAGAGAPAEYGGSHASRVLTIVHEHGYRVHLPTGGAGSDPAGALGGVEGESASRFNPVVTGGGGGGGGVGGGGDGASSVVVEEAVSRAVLSYMQDLDKAATATTATALTDFASNSSNASSYGGGGADDAASAIPMMIAMTMLCASVGAVQVASISCIA